MKNDEKIKKKLIKTIRKKGFSNITVSVNDHIVHLAGNVSKWDEVVEIGHCAGELKGVKGVINTITAKDIEAKIERETREREKEEEKEKEKEKETQKKKEKIKEKEKEKEKKEKKYKKKSKILTYDFPERADVVIIGGGVIGCFIARELARYNLDIVLLEKEADVACGATKANNGQIHTGVGEKSDTLKAKLCAQSWPLYEKIVQELDVPYKKNGLLVVLTEDTLPGIPAFLSRIISRLVIQPIVVRRGKKVGDTPRVIKKKALLKMEPHITKGAVSAVLMPGYGVICPYTLTIALAENAVQNGARIFLETEVTDIITENDTVTKVVTDRGEITTPWVVNAAGVYADDIAEMAGAREYTIHPRKGSILLFDKKLQDHIAHQVSELRFPQDPHTKGGGVLETVNGNMLWGPTAAEVCSKEDTSVTSEELEAMIQKYNPTIPEFPQNAVITYFSGVRAATYTEDFVIRASKVKGFVHAAGIQSPGLTAAPKIAEMVITILREEGLVLEKKDFNPVRKLPPVFSELPVEEKHALIKKNLLYGNVVCRCEHVTEAEIVNTIHGLLPAVTMDAIKRRTRAGMGRCQGGFCGPRVAEILARELKIPLEEVTKKGKGSHLFAEKTKVVQ